MTETTAESPFVQLHALTAPDPKVLNAGPASMLRMAQSFAIESDDDYRLATDELRAVKTKYNALEERRTAITGPLNAALKATNDLFRVPLAALKDAEGAFKASMLRYTSEQERIAAEAKRKAEAAAQAERDRLAAEARRVEEAAAAEAKRLADIEAARIAAAKAEQARLDMATAAAKAAGDAEAARKAEVEAAAQRRRETEAAAEAAVKAEQARRAAALEVAAIQNVSAVIVAPQTGAEPVKVAGVSSAKSFDFEVTDLHTLVKHIAVNPTFLTLLRIDEVKVRGIVRSLGMNANLPGVRVFEKKSVSVRVAA